MGLCRLAFRDLSSSWRPAAGSATASSTWEVTPRAPSSALIRNSIASPVREVIILAIAARLTVAAVGQEVKVVLMRTGLYVHVGMAPGIGRHGFLQVRPLPVLHAGGR